MPLGQAPFGSRQTPRDEEPEPPDEDPRLRSDRLVRQGRWIFMVGGVLMLAFVAARMSGTRASDRNQRGPTGPSPCLTERSCAAGWKCFAVPKDDPFATEGVCMQQCEGDLQCPSQFKCQVVAVTKDRQVVPLGARGATEQQTGVCKPCTQPGGCAAETVEPPAPVAPDDGQE